MSEEDDIDSQAAHYLGIVEKTTQIIITPETERKFGIEGTFWIYTNGMKANHDLPDLEMRGVPGMFSETAISALGEINALRLCTGSPLSVGDTIDWPSGVIQVEQGDDWEGAFTWAAEDMMRLTSQSTYVPSCHGCECAGVEE